jgi:hypothetical protein
LQEKDNESNQIFQILIKFFERSSNRDTSTASTFELRKYIDSKFDFVKYGQNDQNDPFEFFQNLFDILNEDIRKMFEFRVSF